MSVISSFVALVLACGAFLTYEYFAFRDRIITRLETHAEIIASNSASAILFNDSAAATETLAALRAEPHIVSIHVLREDGRVFAAYVRPNAGPVAIPRYASDEPDGARFAREHVIVTHRILSEGAVIGRLYLEADLGEMATRFQRYALIVAGVLVCSLLLAVLLSARLQRRITRPILALVGAARKVSVDKDYAVRVGVVGQDELGMLGRTFNDMLARLEQREREAGLVHDELERRVRERTQELEQEITVRRRLEEQLRHRNDELVHQNQKVQEASRMKSEFLANMSHELRTPLNAILGFSELMHDGKAGAVAAKQQEYLSHVLVSARHLLKLIDDILDLSKVEAGMMEFRPEPLKLSALVTDVSDTLRPLAAKKRIQIATEIDPALDDLLLDRSKLKQVLYNYVSNAIKFTPDEGTVTIRSRPEGVEQVRIEVQDTGIGIRAEDLSRLFVEFQQLDSGAAKKYAGTGLGLALTKKMVEAQGGSCGAESTPGSGSVFFAVLPKKTLGGVARPRRVTRPGGTGRPTALVIEDDDADVEWIEKVLDQAGYAVTVARSGKDALLLVKERPFDRITLDLLLPDVSGWEVLRMIRHDSVNRQTPVIVTSALAEEKAALGFVIQDFLVKPLRAEELVKSLSRASVTTSGPREVLVVDDDPESLALMGDALARAGYGAILERGGRAGLLAVANRRPAAIILDLMMPEMDGFEFLSELHKIPAASRIPVIVWTVQDLTKPESERLRVKVQAVVRKGSERLVQVLDELGASEPQRGTIHGE